MTTSLWAASFKSITLCCAVAGMSLAMIGIADGQEPPAQASADAATLPPWENELTLAVARVDFTSLQWKDLFQDQSELSEKTRERLMHWSAEMQERIQSLRTALNGEPVLLTFGLPETGMAFLPPSMAKQASLSLWSAVQLQILVKNRPGVDLPLAFKALGSKATQPPVIRGEYLTWTSRKSGKDVPDPKLAARFAQPRPEFAAALAAVKEFPVQLAFVPPSYISRTIRELMPELPAMIGGGPSSLLTDGVRWAAIGVDPAQPRLKIIFQSSSPAAAQALAQEIPLRSQRIMAILNEYGVKLTTQQQAYLTLLLRPSAVGDQVVLSLEGPENAKWILALAATAVDNVLPAMAYEEDAQKFKQILLAMHNYHDVYGSFPPAKDVRDADGKTGLSWRVYLLPLIDQGKLYQQFHLDEPWDSPHNIQLLEQMPEVYSNSMFGLPGVSTLKPGYTVVQAPVGEKTVFGWTVPVEIRNITDGTSATIAVVQVKNELAVPWTAPQDYVFDPKNPAAGLARQRHGGFLAAFCDGSVRTIKETISPEMLLRGFQMNDGEIFDME